MTETLIHTPDGVLKTKERRVYSTYNKAEGTFVCDHPTKSHIYCYVKFDDPKLNYQVFEIKVPFECVCVDKTDIQFLDE